MVFGTQIPLVLLKHGTWRWQGPSSPPSSPRIKANCRGWSHPEHTDVLGTQGWALWGVLTPTDPPSMPWSDGAEREKAKDRGFSSDSQENSVHFQSPASQRPSCGDANTLNLTQKNNNSTEQLVKLPNAITAVPTNVQWQKLVLLMILGSGSPTPRCWRDLGRRRRNKTELKQKQRWTTGCPISETICSPSDRDTGGVKAACSTLCAPAPSGLLSGAEIQRQSSNLHYKLHTAVQAWQFHGTAEKTSRNLFCKAVTSVEVWKEHKNTAVQFALRGEGV